MYAYVLEDGLHESNGNLGLLYQVVFSILDFDACCLLLLRVGVLQSAHTMSVIRECLQGDDGRLLGSIKLEPADAHGLTRLHGD